VEKRDAKNRVSYEMHVSKIDGGVEVVALGDLVRNAVPEILEFACQRNIHVVKTGAF
jgi:hypothetical protein